MGQQCPLFLPPRAKAIRLRDREGDDRRFELATGRRLPLSSALKMAVRQEALQITRKEVRHPNPFCRTRAALLLGRLGDRSDIPALKALLHDSTSSCRVIMSYWRQPQKRFEVQLAAGKALVRLLGAEAVPLSDAKLPGANRYMTLEWIELLKKTGVAYRKNEAVGALKRCKCG